jgi:ABC-type sugar transport system permease subunit
MPRTLLVVVVVVVVVVVLLAVLSLFNPATTLVVNAIAEALGLLFGTVVR